MQTLKQVLVIEDDSQTRAFIACICEDLGIKAHQANDGSAGLRIFREFDFDLIITDILMPDRDGIEVIRAIKKLSPKVKIIAVSGGGLIAPWFYLEDAHNLGADEVLFKPFLASQLVDRIEKLQMPSKASQL